jgi:glycosyltransferase involved in cell wall biosynthesis
MGHRVEIVACSNSHVRARQPDVGVQAEQVDVIDGITYRWLRGNAYRGNGVGRLLNIATFLARVWARASRMVRELQPDLVIASSTYPMDVWVARHIARRARCRWIYEVHDLWPLSLIELSGMSQWHPFALLCAWAERSAYRSADAVVSMLPKVHAHMAERGLDLRRLRIVPNGVALQAWEDPPQALRDDIQQTLQVARGKGHRVVGYAGSMGLPNALDTLLGAAALMRHEPVTFVLVGDGHERERLQRRAHAVQLANVHFLAPIPKAQIPGFLQAIDVAYIGWQRVPLYRFGIAPNKLMDYMMAGCPVLHSVEAGNDPVAESGCGLTVPPEDPRAVMAGLLHLLNLPEPQRKTMGEAGRAFVRAHHAYDVLARRFLDNPQAHTP